jgi:hypothetical protein
MFAPPNENNDDNVYTFIEDPVAWKRIIAPEWISLIADLMFTFHKYTLKYGTSIKLLGVDKYHFTCEHWYDSQKQPEFYNLYINEVVYVLDGCCHHDKTARQAVTDQMDRIQSFLDDLKHNEAEENRLENLRTSALSKLTDEEKKVLGIK